MGLGIVVVGNALVVVSANRNPVRVAVVRLRVPDAAIVAGSYELGVADGNLADELAPLTRRGP